MRFLIDENLPRRLAGWLVSRGHEADHALALGLRGASDVRVWRMAVERQACIVTKDSDFVTLAIADATCQVVRLRIGNCTTDRLLDWLNSIWPEAENSLDAGTRVVELHATENNPP